jgi:hypothetical protein
VNIDSAQRALDRARARLDRASTDGQIRAARRDVESAEDDLRRANDKAAAKLERQGYEVTSRRRW